MVIKQVAVDRDHTGLGIATRLYAQMIGEARCARLVAATVDTPPNNRSRRFHRRLGFTEAFRVPHPDGRIRTVWQYNRERASDTVLSTQYETAVGLYRHEDTLNWSKLQNYLYITVATAAASGFLLIQGEGQEGTVPVLPVPALVLALCGIGLLTSVAFAVALVNGTIYLHTRKQAVCELEEMYLNRGGVRVVSTFLRGRLLQRSPTMWTLRLTPIIGAAGWLALGVILIIR